MKLAITDQLGRSLGRRSRHPGLPFHENTEGPETFTSSLTVGGHESKSSVDEDLKAKEIKKLGLLSQRRLNRTELTDRSIYHDSTFNLFEPSGAPIDEELPVLHGLFLFL